MNWSTVIQELQATGLPIVAIAGACDLSPQAVTDIKHGRTLEPKGMSAVKLYALHKRITRKRSAA